MLTPDVLVAAAGPRAAFTVTQTWLIAIGSGIVATVAFGTLPMVTRSRRRLGLPARLGVGLLTSSVGALPSLAMSVGEHDAVAGLHTYTLAMLSMAVMRVIFTRWFKRVAAARLSGTPFKTSSTKVTVVALVTFPVICVSLALVLTWLPTVLGMTSS